MLILFEHADGDGYIFFEDNKVETVRVRNNMILYSLLLKLKRKGIPKVIEYSCKGKVRRRTIFKPVKDKEQILEFLQSFDDNINIHNIETLEDYKSDSTYEEVTNTDISIYKLKKYIGVNKSFREFSNRYEYCLIKDYEEQFEDFECHSISLGDIFPQILILKNEVLLMSLEFSKDKFTLKKIIAWMNRYDVTIIKNSDTEYIENAAKIIESLKFKGTSIVLYKKGKEHLEVDKNKMPEITETFKAIEQVINTSESKVIE